MTTSLKDIRALLSPLYRLVFIKPKWRKMERASALKFATKLQKNSCFEGIIVHGAVNRDLVGDLGHAGRADGRGRRPDPRRLLCSHVGITLSLGISTESLSHSQDVGGCLHKPEKKMSHMFPSNNDLKSIDHPQCFISILR